MHFWELMLWRLMMVLITYFFLSLAYSLVSLAFQIPFSNTFYRNDVTVARTPDAYGHATFFVYWMLNWVGMSALGLASENVTMVIGQPWTAMWLIFWFVTYMPNERHRTNSLTGLLQMSAPASTRSHLSQAFLDGVMLGHYTMSSRPAGRLSSTLTAGLGSTLVSCSPGSRSTLFASSLLLSSSGELGLSQIPVSC